MADCRCKALVPVVVTRGVPNKPWAATTRRPAYRGRAFAAFHVGRFAAIVADKAPFVFRSESFQQSELNYDREKDCCLSRDCVGEHRLRSVHGIHER